MIDTFFGESELCSAHNILQTVMRKLHGTYSDYQPAVSARRTDYDPEERGTFVVIRDGWHREDLHLLQATLMAREGTACPLENIV